MAERVIVENPGYLKAGLAIGLLLFLGGGAYALLHAVLSEGAMPGRIATAISGALFVYLGAAAAPLLRYLNHRLEITDSGVRVLHGASAIALDWASLGYRARDTLQVLTLLGPDGRPVYAVDYWATNARVLLQALAERDDDADEAGY